MEYDLHMNQFMLDNDNVFIDWSFATDSLSDIPEIVSAKNLLVPFPDSIRQVDFEIPDLRPFATLDDDHIFVPNYQVPWYHVKDETSQSYVPFEVCPLNPEQFVPESMDTGKSAKNEQVLTQGLYVDTNSTSIVHDHIQVLEAFPISPALIAPEALGTSKSAKNEAVFTQGMYVNQKAVNLVEQRVTTERRDTGRARLAHMCRNDIKRYFYMPITQAAKEMKVGLTILKKRCRELGIPRWPHRKMKSLRSLINNAKESGSPTVRNMTNELEVLGRLMEENPEMQLTEKTKKLRQACFKANYKKRRGQLTNYQPRF